MKAFSFSHYVVILLLFAGCASTTEVIYDYNMDTDFSAYDTYVLCVDDFSIEHSNHPNIDNETTRRLIADAVAFEMENRNHKTNVFDPQLQAGFKIIISEETVKFNNCEHSSELEYWESCTIHEETYEQETLITYVADFKTNKVLWHATIPCNLNKPKNKLQPYISELVAELFNTYPKPISANNDPDYKKSLK